MFYAIRRMIKLFVLLCFLGFFFVLYLHRNDFEPAFVWYDVWDNGGITNKTTLPEIRGHATALFNSRTFQFRTDQGKILAVRLTGLNDVGTPATSAEVKEELHRRDLLRPMVLSNYLHIDVTYSNLNSVLGIVYSGSTNVNTRLIAIGSAQLKTEYIKSLPAKSQYDFFYARRAAAKRNETDSEKPVQLGAK
jgi:hypothetical protein